MTSPPAPTYDEDLLGSPIWLTTETVINLRAEGVRLRDSDKCVQIVLDDLHNILEHNSQPFVRATFETHVRRLLRENASLADLRSRQGSDR